MFWIKFVWTFRDVSLLFIAFEGISILSLLKIELVV